MEILEWEDFLTDLIGTGSTFEGLCTDTRGMGGGKGLVPVSTGIVTSQGDTTVTLTNLLDVSPLDILYKNFKDKLVSFRKIFLVSTYLPSHTSVTDVSTFSTTK